MKRKKTPERKVKLHQRFEQAIRERPRDASPRLIYADWLMEQGEDEAAEMQLRKAKQCTRFDPDFDYSACLRALKVVSKVRVELIAFGEIVRLSPSKPGGGSDRFCDAERMQAWLLEQAVNRKGRSPAKASGLDWFWAHVPGVSEAEEVEGEDFSAALQAAFEASKGPEYRESKYAAVRSVGQGYHVRRGGRKKPRWTLVAEDYINPKISSKEKRFVWCVDWDSGGPGAGAGSEEVYQIGGRYYYHTDSSTGQRYGPYRNLLPLLKRTGLNHATLATVDIYSPLFSAEEIVAMLEVYLGVPHEK